MSFFYRLNLIDERLKNYKEFLIDEEFFNLIEFLIDELFFNRVPTLNKGNNTIRMELSKMCNAAYENKC